uniref:Uncharacterized protein n=1 Tax=Picea glauca TaxID=3330 RepID=A0A101M2N8_PICGL|nr:hypothetical protein ABT39_MTgene3040 [Picea glauca]
MKLLYKPLGISWQGGQDLTNKISQPGLGWGIKRDVLDCTYNHQTRDQSRARRNGRYRTPKLDFHAGART